jgi:adenylate cyclase class 2
MEYEVKIPVEDLSRVKEKILSSGWLLEARLKEVDNYIDLTECAGVPEDTALRVRLKEDLINHKTSGEITYKGPQLEEKVKAREELTARVDDPEKVVEMFIKLGFRLFRVSKYREIYAKPGKKGRIYLDDVEGLGRFLEIEVINPSDRSEFREALDEIEEELGLKGKPEIVKPYLTMMLEAR